MGTCGGVSRDGFPQEIGARSATASLRMVGTPDKKSNTFIFIRTGVQEQRISFGVRRSIGCSQFVHPESFLGKRGYFLVISKIMANKEQHSEKKNKKKPRKTKAEKRAEKIARENSRK